MFKLRPKMSENECNKCFTFHGHRLQLFTPQTLSKARYWHSTFDWLNDSILEQKKKTRNETEIIVTFSPVESHYRDFDLCSRDPGESMIHHRHVVVQVHLTCLLFCFHLLLSAVFFLGKIWRRFDGTVSVWEAEFEWGFALLTSDLPLSKYKLKLNQLKCIQV